MLEVLIGMLILSIGLLLLMPMMVVSMQANDFGKGFTEASMLIKEKMEEVKNMASPTSGADSVDQVARTWTVTAAGANLKRVVVTVNWAGPDGRPHSHSMVSYIMAQ